MHAGTHTHKLFPFLCSSPLFFFVFSSINTSSLLSLCFSHVFSPSFPHPHFSNFRVHIWWLTCWLGPHSNLFSKVKPTPLSQRWAQLCDFRIMAYVMLCDFRSGLYNRICFVFVSLSLGTQTHALSKPRERIHLVLDTAPSNVSADGQHQQLVKWMNKSSDGLNLSAAPLEVWWSRDELSSQRSVHILDLEQSVIISH